MLYFSFQEDKPNKIKYNNKLTQRRIVEAMMTKLTFDNLIPQ